jgi:hypothetical protein
VIIMKPLRVALATACLVLPLAPQALAVDVFQRDFSKFVYNNCPLSSYCAVDFGTVPANKVFEIKSVSCYAGQDNTSGSILYWYFTAYNQPAQYGQIHLRPTKLGISNTTLTWNATETGIVRAPAGAHLQVALQGASAGAIAHLQCTIGGALFAVQ